MKAVVVLTASVLFLAPSFAQLTGGATDAPAPHVKWSKMITPQDARYCGWPTVTSVGSNELVAVYSGDRSDHICPWGRVRMVRTADGGGTWTKPADVQSGLLDDRDAGVLKLANGDWLLFWFTSIAFTDPATLARNPEWRRHYEKLSPDAVRRELGAFVSRSTDGGKTWGPRVRMPVSAPHGGIQLRDGRVIVVGAQWHAVRGHLKGDPEEKAHRDDDRRIYAAESKDGGATWQIISELSFAEAPSGELCEPHLIEGEDGVLRAYIRNINLVYSESRDGGKTWSPMKGTPIACCYSPAHLLRLADGRILMTCARRGQRRCVFALVGDRNGSLESFVRAKEMPICLTDGDDMGYASSAQTADGSIVTVFYCHHEKRGPACIYAVDWTLP